MENLPEGAQWEKWMEMKTNANIDIIHMLKLKYDAVQESKVRNLILF